MLRDELIVDGSAIDGKFLESGCLGSCCARTETKASGSCTDERIREIDAHCVFYPPLNFVVCCWVMIFDMSDDEADDQLLDFFCHPSGRPFTKAGNGVTIFTCVLGPILQSTLWDVDTGALEKTSYGDTIISIGRTHELTNDVFTTG